MLCMVSLDPDIYVFIFPSLFTPSLPSAEKHLLRFLVMCSCAGGRCSPWTVILSLPLWRVILRGRLQGSRGRPGCCRLAPLSCGVCCPHLAVEFSPSLVFSRCMMVCFPCVLFILLRCVMLLESWLDGFHQFWSG